MRTTAAAAYAHPRRGVFMSITQEECRVRVSPPGCFGERRPGRRSRSAIRAGNPDPHSALPGASVPCTQPPEGEHFATMRRIVIALSASLLILAAAPVRAHHSAAAFDT